MTPFWVVSPYRAMAPESRSHRELGPFDWVAALEMLRASVRASNGCETLALSDQDTDVGRGPVCRYPTAEPRLMLWILEVSLAYLASRSFDRDTVFVSPDTLVVGDLRPYFAGDLTLLVRMREKYHNRPMINAVQWWPVRAQSKLVAFYTQALAIARGLDANFQAWGADSEALRQLVAPVALGVHVRAGLKVSMREANRLLWSLTGSAVAQMAAGPIVPPQGFPILDFKDQRKRHMAAYFEAARCA